VPGRKSRRRDFYNSYKEELEEEMKQKKSAVIKSMLLGTAAVMAAGLLAANDANATNGYFSHGYSIKNKGMAGAGVALPLDAMGAATNPGLITEVGNRLDLGLTIFSPSRDYTVSGYPSGYEGTFPLSPGKVESDSNYFFIPSLGWNKMLNENSAVGIAVYGNGGMNTDYPTNTFWGTNPTGVDLMQLFIAPTYAYKFAGKHSFGITPIIAAQFFASQGLQAFGEMSESPGNLTNNGHDTSYGFGGRIGYFGQLTDKFSVGLSYQTRIYMDEFSDYAGLFAEQGDFDIPANWTVGLAFKPIPTVAIAFDVQQIYYSDIDSIANPLLPNLMQTPLGSNNGAGFGWEDMTVFKIGLQWARSEQWTYRFGYSYGEQPIPNSEVLFNILAPGVIEQHATFGLTYTFANKSELDFSFMYAFDKSVTGPNPLEAPGQQSIEISMNQWEVGVGYSWKF
jgi:long-chain fatty acid transport protein